MIVLFILVFLGSLIAASFLGHTIHWVIHQRWSGPGFRGHMEHHLQRYPPNDLLSKSYRKARWYQTGTFLFLPGMITFVLAGSVFLSYLGCGWGELALFVIMLGAFGIINDYVHDATHVIGHPLECFAWFRNIREAHFVHHRDLKSNYGIVFYGWDKVFGSYRRQ